MAKVRTYTSTETGLAADPLAPPLAELIKRDMPPVRRPAVSPKDLASIVWIAAAHTAAVALPRAMGLNWARAVSRLLPSMWPDQADIDAAAAALGIGQAEATQMFQLQRDQKFFNSLLFFRHRARGDGQHLDLFGEEHVFAALERGRGCIIWIADLMHGSDAARNAFWDAGLPLTHMRRPEHGFSSSAWGIRHLNPLRVNWEVKHLARGLCYDRDDPAPTMAAMLQTLKDNGLLSVMATNYEGRVLARAPFLKGTTTIAAGPTRLAFEAGCPILPVFTLPGVEDGHLRVVVEEPLFMQSSDRKLAQREACGDYLARLEKVVVDYPHIWRGWETYVPRREPAAAPLMQASPLRHDLWSGLPRM